MEEWVNLNTFDYDIECNVCHNVMTIIQHGKPLIPCVLNRILLEAHIKNTYDSYAYYHVNNNSSILRVEVDIVGNKECKS